ncbi:MAG: HAD family hydrolase [Fuerstiella sp.]
MAVSNESTRNLIQAVVFDAVGTVMFPQPSVAAAYQAAIKQHCGQLVPTEIVNAAVRDGLKQRSAGLDLTTSEESERQFWADLIHRLCPDSTGFQACFDALFEHFGSSDSWKCFPGVGDVIGQLQQQHMVVAIASNFDNRLNSVCDGLNELSGISQRIISSQVGFRKPAGEFFCAVVETLNIPAANILMVGDDLINDVQGALNAGFQSAWICRSEPTTSNVADEVLVLSDLSELPSFIENTNRRVSEYQPSSGQQIRA